MADTELQRKLKIKTGVVKRLTKEKTCYEKEAEAETTKLNKLKKEKAEEHTIRKQNEILQESRAMIPDCQGRLETGVDDLKKFMNDHPELSEHKEEHEAAKTALKDAAKSM